MKSSLKQYTSKFLKAVAWAYVGFPLVFMVGVAILFDIPARSILSELFSPFFYVLSALGVAVGYGLLNMQRWSWYLFVFVNILMVYESTYLLVSYGESHHKLMALILFFGFLLAIVIRVRAEVNVPYFLPKIRWWESYAKDESVVPIAIEFNQTGKALNGKLMDLAVQGCFIKVDHDFVIGNYVDLRFQVFSQKIFCKGLVVWNASSSVTHPKGVGIKFVDFNRYERRKMKVASIRFKKMPSIYKKSKNLLNSDQILKEMNKVPTKKDNELTS